MQHESEQWSFSILSVLVFKSFFLLFFNPSFAALNQVKLWMPHWNVHSCKTFLSVFLLLAHRSARWCVSVMWQPFLNLFIGAVSLKGVFVKASAGKLPHFPTFFAALRLIFLLKLVSHPLYLWYYVHWNFMERTILKHRKEFFDLFLYLFPCLFL